MRVAALVVGCDDYPDPPVRTGPGAEAANAVSDAIAMRDWLLADGGVAASDLRMLLSPAPGIALADGMRVDGPADPDRLAAEVEHLIDSCAGDRLYVYIAARGCPSTPGAAYLAQPLILLPRPDSETGAGTPVVGIAVEELAGWLAKVDFGEVVTIIDGDRGPTPMPDRTTPVLALGGDAGSARRSATAMQFRLETFAPAGAGIMPEGASVRLTSALLAALSGDGDGGAHIDGPAGDRAGLRWSSLEPYLTSVLSRAPLVAGPDPALVLTPLALADRSRVSSRGAPPVRPADQGEVHLRSTDPNAMLFIEDRSGARCAVGVGSIAGRLPAGDYTAVLADPCGPDPRVPLIIGPGLLTDLELGPRPRADGFRATEDPSLTWSSPAAQLALATADVWARGHQSFLLVGGAPSVPPAELLLEGFPDRFASHGVFTSGDFDAGAMQFGAIQSGDMQSGHVDLRGSGWWVAVPVHGPWHTVGLGDHRITVPAAPDSVSAIAITETGTAVALFDTTHPQPEEIAAQDRVQEYLASGRLGAADLTSRSSVRTGRRWPWGATAAVRRLIDRTRSSRQSGGSAGGRSHTGTVPRMSLGATGAMGSGFDSFTAPPFEFRMDVPPDLRRLLVGTGPWAVWLDWPPAGVFPGVSELPLGMGAD